MGNFNFKGLYTPRVGYELVEALYTNNNRNAAGVNEMPLDTYTNPVDPDVEGVYESYTSMHPAVKSNIVGLALIPIGTDPQWGDIPEEDKVELLFKNLEGPHIEQFISDEGGNIYKLDIWHYLPDGYRFYNETEMNTACGVYGPDYELWRADNEGYGIDTVTNFNSYGFFVTSATGYSDDITNVVIEIQNIQGYIYDCIELD